MTEEEARGWIALRYGTAGIRRLETLCDLIRAETSRQNLVAASTLEVIWTRHIVDSAQLLDLVPARTGDQWVDIGSGAGFPGLVIATLGDCAALLVEPRKRRAAFLEEAIEALGLANAVVRCSRVEDVSTTATIISARAVAPLPMLFTWGAGCSSPETVWLLPKGRTAREEVATAQQAWHGVFHVEHSITDPESMIVRASGVTLR